MNESRKFYPDHSFHWKKNALEDVKALESEVSRNQERIMDYENRAKNLDEENAKIMKKISRIMKAVRESEKKNEQKSWRI